MPIREPVIAATPIRGKRAVGRRDALHLFALSKRGASWAYYTPAQFRLTSPPENVETYLWGSRTVKHHFCASSAAALLESPDWSTGKPDFDNPKVGVNSRLLDDFDLDAVPVTSSTEQPVVSRPRYAAKSPICASIP